MPQIGSALQPSGTLPSGTLWLSGGPVSPLHVIMQLRWLAVPVHGSLPQALSPGREALRGPDIVEQFSGCEGVEVGFGQPACQLRPRRLGVEGDAFFLPLDIFRGPPRNKLAEEEIHHSGTHGFHQTCRLTPAPGA